MVHNSDAHFHRAEENGIYSFATNFEITKYILWNYFWSLTVYIYSFNSKLFLYLNTLINYLHVEYFFMLLLPTVDFFFKLLFH